MCATFLGCGNELHPTGGHERTREGCILLPYYCTKSIALNNLNTWQIFSVVTSPEAPLEVNEKTEQFPSFTRTLGCLPFKLSVRSYGTPCRRLCAIFRPSPALRVRFTGISLSSTDSSCFVSMDATNDDSKMKYDSCSQKHISFTH